ncbi:MAG: DUF916 domain-containing protein [Patulibacter minatonensis]
MVDPSAALRRLRHCAILLVLVAGSGSVLPTGASAADDTPSLEGLSVRPVSASGAPLRGSYFNVSRNPGSRFIGFVELRNDAREPLGVHVAPVDATTSQATGGTTFLDRSAPRRSTGAWITTDAGAVTLGPGGTRRVRVDVRIPRDATAGDHVGGVVVEPDRRVPIPGATTSRRVLRVITAVRVRVRGRVRSELDIARPRLARSGDTPVLTVRLANVGDTLCRPVLTAALLQDDDLIGSEHREVETLLPNTAIDYVVRWGRPVADDRYDVQVRAEGCGAPAAARESLALGSDPARPAEHDAGGAAPAARVGATSTTELVGLAGGLLLVGALGWGLARRLPRRRT